MMRWLDIYYWTCIIVAIWVLVWCSGCSSIQQPAVTIEVPVAAGGQCFELPGTIRVSYYEQRSQEPLALRLGKALVDFGLLDSIWNSDK